MQKECLFYCTSTTYFSRIEDNHGGDAFQDCYKTAIFSKPNFQLKPADDPSAE